MTEKKSLLSKPNVPRVDLPEIKNTVNRPDYLRDKNEKPDTQSFHGVRLSKANTKKLNALTKMKDHDSVNDLVTVIVDMYILGELTKTEIENFEIMIKYL